MGAFIKYQSTGKVTQDVTVSVSFNNGKSWKVIPLKAGQSFPIPGNTTNLLIDNIPYDYTKSYEIRDGRIAKK